MDAQKHNQKPQDPSTHADLYVNVSNDKVEWEMTWKAANEPHVETENQTTKCKMIFRNKRDGNRGEREKKKKNMNGEI